MINAKQELLDAIKGHAILCASIQLDLTVEPVFITLKKDYSQSDFDAFLGCLDLQYDSGYGSQELHGIVWLSDNAWLERGEYDGEEWWELKKYPKFTKEVLE